MITDKPKHDQIFKKAMENPVVAYEFLNTYLPKNVLSLLDIKTLKLEKESYIEQDLTSSFSDVVFSAKFNSSVDGKGKRAEENQEDGYIFLLLEHQSTSDRMMAFRLFKYMMLICERYMTMNPKAKNLPLVYPMVIYNGTMSYNAPLNIWDLFINPELARDSWTNDYQLLNVHEIPDEELKQKVWSGILLFFLKHIHERQLLKRWEQIADILPELTKISIGYDYIAMMVHFTLPFIDKSDKIALGKVLTSSINKEKGEELMGSLAQAWKEEGIEIGVQDGIKIGEARGKAEGKAEIVRAMLIDGDSVEKVARITGLSIEDIQKLKD